MLGWKLLGNFPQVDKAVFIVVSHTSWVDFLLGLLIRRVWNQEINYIGKKSLFKFPFGWYFKWMGGTPIDRGKHNNNVNAIVQTFNNKKIYRLALSPEGTRKKVTKWKTGFYYIAKAANVPIVMVAFDYGKKQIKISEPYFSTENKEADFALYKSFFRGTIGKIAKKSF